jgi:hypothetical protein
MAKYVCPECGEAARKRVESWMDENVGKLKRARSRQVSDYGRADGYRAGQRARTGEAEIDQHRALTG